MGGLCWRGLSLGRVRFDTRMLWEGVLAVMNIHFILRSRSCGVLIRVGRLEVISIEETWSMN